MSTTPTDPLVCFRALRLVAVTLTLLCATALSAADSSAKITFNVAAGEAATTLKQFAQQAKREVMFPVQSVGATQTNAVQGELTVKEGLDRLLAGTELSAIEDAKTGAIMVKGPASPNARRAALAAESARPEISDKVEGKVITLDKFEVFDSKSINLDIPRTRNDAQPYVVFDSVQIQNSQATNLGDFFRTRLPMATPNGPEGNGPFGLSPQVSSSINLRGLGTNQTMILVDGRPMPAISGGGSTIRQADINGIPLSMIERVEILPATASGIYGGGATGGVINIITRKDFSGAVLTLNYLNTFDTDSAQRREDFTASVNLRGGDTVLTFTASYSDSNELLVGDRDFSRRARELGWKNYPDLYIWPPLVGYTTNIYNQNGTNLVLKPQYGGTTLSSPITYIPVGYAGIASDNAAALVANAGRYNLDLPNTAYGSRAPQVATNPVKSLGLGVRQKLTGWLEGYADYFQSRNSSITNALGPQTTATLAATAPNNPFTTDVDVSFPLPGFDSKVFENYDTTRASAGLVAKLPGGWQTAFDYTWARMRYSSRTSGPAVGDPDGSGPGLYYQAAYSTGALDVMRDLNVRPLDFTPYLMPAAVSNYTAQNYSSITEAATIRASGPVFRLPTGDIVVSTSVDWRQDRNDAGINSRWLSDTSPTLTYFYLPATSQTNRSEYAEAKVPLLGPLSGAAPEPRLELQLASRYDASHTRTYKSNFTSTVPSPDGPFPAIEGLTRDINDTTYTAGLRYAPLPDFAIRASFGTGFLAPSRAQLRSGSVRTGASYSNIIDAKRGNVPRTIGPVTVLSGGDSNLRPEHSESTSAGVIFTPRALPGFRLSVDYTKITKTDEITTLSLQQILDSEAFLPGVLTRAALTDADRALGYTGGAITQLDLRPVNVAERKVEAVDVQADYTRKVALGEFRFYGVATWNGRFSQQITPTSLKVDSVGYFGGPLKWSGNAGVDWSRGPWSAGWNVHYYGEQVVYPATSTTSNKDLYVRVQGSDHYPDQYYHDIQVAYRFGPQTDGWRGLLADVRLSVGIQNLFNSEPPLSVLSAGFGSTQPLEDPRLRRYSLNLQKRF